MKVVRRLSILLAGGLVAAGLCVGWFRSRPELSADAAAQLESATSFFDSTAERARYMAPRGVRGDQLVLGLGYLERLRLGLGSPFRLADAASRDPRLGEALQRRVAWAVLGRVRRGDAYRIDPSALDGLGPWTSDGRGARGADHLALIEQAISRADDPRAGELALRLSYMVAAAAGTVSPSAPAIAARAAALERDKQLAAADLRTLLRDAKLQQTDVLEELGRRRESRQFDVEQPPLAPLSTAMQVAAMNQVPSIVRAIDSLAVASEHSRDPRRGSARAEPQGERPTAPLGRAFAARLVELGSELPPLAPIVVTMRSHEEPASNDNQRSDGVRARFGARAVNEETLAGSFALVADAPDSARRVSALALLSAATALRTLAQDRPWFPGMSAPTVSQLNVEFGVQSVAFDPAIPVAWRAYYLTQLGGALRDFQSVLPAFFATGLRVDFGIAPLPDSALAMHDPRTRTLRLSIATSAGTLAHELAHDLDWQAARRLFAGAGGYSTDHAMHEQRGSLASSMRGLAEARPIGTPTYAGAPRTARPAELFARSTDWFVTTILAREGRVNGFLSAAQDPMLTGYAAGYPTAIGAVGTQSLISALEQMTYLPDSVRDGFLMQWSDRERVDPVILVRRVLDAQLSWRGVSQSPFASSIPRLPVSGESELACLFRDDSPATRARLRLITLAVDARARGAAIRRARARPLTERSAWAHSLLGTPPWSPAEGERVVEQLRANLIAELTTSPAHQGVVTTGPSIFEPWCQTPFTKR